jgi:uncharacterized protein YjiS (DUF1127 family)
MSDPNWISAANTHHPEPVLSKNGTDFDAEASSRSPHFCSALKQRSIRYSMPLRTTLGPPRRAAQRPSNSALRHLIGLLWRWRERAHSRRQLCELDDRILQDIGLTRDAVLRETTRPFWQ